MKPHAAAVRATKRVTFHDIDYIAAMYTEEYQPLVQKVVKAIAEIRCTSALTGNGRIADYLDEALRTVVGEEGK